MLLTHSATLLADWIALGLPSLPAGAGTPANLARLAGGPGPTEGRLQMQNGQYSRVWATLCSASWQYDPSTRRNTTYTFGLAEARVACRHLRLYGGTLRDGSAYGMSLPVPYADVSSLPMATVLPQCTGEEDNLFNCQLPTTRSCGFSAAVGLECNVS